MKSDSLQAKNVDEYIAIFPEEVQLKLQQIRDTIRKAAPEAEELISYQMPAYKQQEVLVYFAAYKNHIGFYPTSSGIKAFQKELSAYKSSKGAVQFPIGEPLPLKLVKDMVKYRLSENLRKAEDKKARRS